MERLCFPAMSVRVIIMAWIIMEVTAKPIVPVIIFVVVHLTRAIVVIPCH